VRASSRRAGLAGDRDVRCALEEAAQFEAGEWFVVDEDGLTGSGIHGSLSGKGSRETERGGVAVMRSGSLSVTRTQPGSPAASIS